MNIWYVMLCEFKKNKNATETVTRMCNVCLIIDWLAWNWFSKFCCGDTLLRDEPWPGLGANQILIKML